MDMIFRGLTDGLDGITVEHNDMLPLYTLQQKQTADAIINPDLPDNGLTSKPCQMSQEIFSDIPRVTHLA